MSIRPRLVGALLGSLAAFGIAGVVSAGAQETPTTGPPAAEAPSTAPAPDSTAPAPGRSGDCHHDGGTDSRTDAPAVGNTNL